MTIVPRWKLLIGAYIYQADCAAPTDVLLTFLAPPPLLYLLIYFIIQLVVTSADNNAVLIFSIKLNEPVGTADQIRTKPGALSHQWQKKKKKISFLAV